MPLGKQTPVEKKNYSEQLFLYHNDTEVSVILLFFLISRGT